MTLSEDSRLTRTSQSTATSGTMGGRTATGRTRSSASRQTTAAVVGGVRAWRRTRRFARDARAWLAQTVSPAGRLLAVLAVLGLVVGFAAGWVEALAAGIVCTVLLLLCVPFLFSARAYDVSLRLAHDRVVAGTEVTGALSVVNVGAGIALPGRVDVPVGEGLIDVRVPTLRRRGGYEERIVVPTRRRGIVTIGPARSVRGDPLGILTREASWSETHTLYVHPRTTALPPTSTGFVRDLEGNPSAEVVPSDISFHAIREYAPGDARRHVHWKSTAKTGRLMVRQYEETRRSRMIVVLALADDEYADDDEFELAVSVAASLAARGIRDGRDVSFVLGGTIPEFARLAIRSIREAPTIDTRILLDDLAGVETAEHVTRLRDVAALAAEAHRDASVAFLVCGSTPSPRSLQQAALSFPADTGTAAVVCDPAAAPGVRRLGAVDVLKVGVLDDLRQLLSRRAAS